MRYWDGKNARLGLEARYVGHQRASRELLALGRHEDVRDAELGRDEHQR